MKLNDKTAVYFNGKEINATTHPNMDINDRAEIYFVENSQRLNVFIPDIKPMSMNLLTVISTTENSKYPNSVT